MALPTTHLGWVDYLSRRHDAEIPALEMLDRYYEGTQPLTYMHPEVLREVQERIAPVLIAWPMLVVDSVDERLDVEGFRLPGAGAADDELWRVWQVSGLDEESQKGHVDAMVMRRSYACVGTNERDPATPLVTVESPLEMYADVDPRTRKVRAALRRVSESGVILGRTSERYATLYLPDVTVWYRWADGWREDGRDEHGLGEVPVVPLVNRPRLRASRRSPVTGGTIVQHGTSELAPVLPLSDSANKLATDMMIAAEFTALPLRGFWGVGADAFKDVDGNMMTALQTIMRRVLTFPDPPGDSTGNGGREFEFKAASLANFHESINSLARLVASIAGLPPDYLGLATDNPPSAESRLAGEIRLIKRAERKQLAFGGSWEQVMRLVRRFQSGDWDPLMDRLETDWRDAATPTVAQRADAAVKLRTAGITSLRQAREDLGYTPVQIALMEADDERALSRDPMTAIVERAAQ